MCFARLGGPPEQRTDKFGRRYRVYCGARCADCGLRERCTESKYGRPLKRYEGEELKEAMVQVLSQPAARAKYHRRSAIVEPLFAELRERQGLQQRDVHGGRRGVPREAGRPEGRGQGRLVRRQAGQQLDRAR